MSEQIVTRTESNVKYQLLAVLGTLDRGDSPDSKFPDAKGEYWALCPFHNDTHSDDFSVSERGYYCFACGQSGGLIELARHLKLTNDTEGLFRLTPEAKADLERKRRKQEKARHKRHLTAIQRLQRERKDIVYHRNLNDNSGLIQRKWGITQDTIEWFKVGYCHACPTSPYSDSITIPYYYHDKLINLRHRLSSPNGQGKYRPEMAGLPSAIFNADLLESEAEDWVILVEGEFKAMVLCQYGLPAIAIPGATNFKEKWAKLFDKIQKVYIALDPGVEKAAYRIGLMLSKAGVDARIVTLPCKPDDFIVLYGGDIGQLCRYLELGRQL